MPESQESLRTAMVQPNFYWTLTTPLANFVGLYSGISEGGETRSPQIGWFINEPKRYPQTCDYNAAPPRHWEYDWKARKWLINNLAGTPETSLDPQPPIPQPPYVNGPHPDRQPSHHRVAHQHEHAKAVPKPPSRRATKVKP